MTSFFNTVVGGNPFATPVGAKIEQATDASLASENWALNMEICDLINETEDGPRDAVKAIRKRLQQAAGKNYTVVMFTLTVLETCVKNCGKRFHVLVCTKDFVNELVKLIGPKNGPPPAVQEKVLYLIQSWVDAFHRHQEMNGVIQVYQELKIKGVEFPMTDLDAMAPIHTPKKSVVASGVGDDVTDVPYGRPLTAPPVTASGGAVPCETLSSLTQEQMTKLRADLDVLQTNMAVFGEMLNELVPGNEHASDIELFQDLHTTLVAMQQRLVELISRLSNDEMTADLLRINDHLNNLFLRYSRYEKNRGAVKDPSAPQPSGPDSLIDLNDEAAGGVATVSKKMEAMGIGSQLASLDTVTAQSGPTRPTVTADKDETDFDSFAQSRKVTYTNSKTGSTYEANSRPEHVSGNLGEAFEERAQSGPPSTTTDSILMMHKESDFDEMAKWLAEGGLGSTEESLTSSEFDRFLAERAAAAEGLPTASSTKVPKSVGGGGGGGGAAGGSAAKKQPSPQDGSFYAL